MKRVVPSPPPSDPLTLDPPAFGRAIRAARTAAGMTLVDAAATMGVSKQTLSDLEKATGSVGLAIALRVARELGVGVFAVQPAQRETARQALLDQASSSEGET
jgi:transcriptional regulator with XRE-family HTH domain